MTEEIIPIRERMLFDFRQPMLYTAQWDGTKQQATLLIGELERVLEEMGASVVAANYRALLGRGSADLVITVGRHSDDREWTLNIQREHWLVIWRGVAGLIDAETILPEAGVARFQQPAPIIVLRGRAPEIDGD